MKVHIKAFDAKNVLKNNSEETSHIYLRFRLKGKDESTCQAHVKTSTLNPIWNQEFDVISTDLLTDILEVDMMTKNSKMMNTIKIKLNNQEFGSHFIFDNDIKYKKKKLAIFISNSIFYS